MVTHDSLPLYNKKQQLNTMYHEPPLSFFHRLDSCIKTDMKTIKFCAGLGKTLLHLVYLLSWYEI